MDVLSLLDEIEDIIEDASTIPFSKKIILDSGELLEIIKEIRIKLPDEIKQAAWVKDERDRILKEAQRDAENMLNDAENKLEELVEKEKVTQMAKERAERIIDNSQKNANEIRLGAMEYADDLLFESQEKLKEVIQLIDENRKELRE